MKLIVFLSFTEPIDTRTPGGRLVFHLFGALGEFERNLIQERTRAGLVAAATQFYAAVGGIAAICASTTSASNTASTASSVRLPTSIVSQVFQPRRGGGSASASN